MEIRLRDHLNSNKFDDGRKECLVALLQVRKRFLVNAARSTYDRR